MEIPPITYPVWNDVVTGKRSVAFDFLALRIFMMSTQMDIARDSSPARVTQRATELREVFVKNATHPKVQADLKKIYP